MDQCITLSLFLLQLLTFLLTSAVILFQDFNHEKNKFDNDGKKYAFFKNYWPLRWDDVARKWLWGALGALLAGELGLWAIQELTNIPPDVQGHLDLTLIAVCTYFAPKIFNRK